MKTLDEVITGMTELILSGKTADVKSTVRDALSYLKEYKANQEDPDGDHQQLEKCRALLQDFYRNDPLSWDELKGMEGKPVFVEERYRNGDLKSSGWWLIDYWNDDQICLRDQGGNSWFIYQAGMGWAWKAYRKEREL